MHGHAGAGAMVLLEVAVLCAVWSVSLFAVRRLIADWGRLHDRATPVAHTGMGLAMGYTLLAPPPARPVVVGLAAGFALVAAGFCRRAVSGRSSAYGPRASYQLATASMAAVMAVMVVGVGRGSSVVVLALVGCLVCCAVVYGRAMLSSWHGDDRRGWAGAGANLTLTASMVAMLSVP
jgi:hypothetical protein